MTSRRRRLGSANPHSAPNKASPVETPIAGMRVLLEPREGPFGRRSVVTSQAGGEIALWQFPARTRPERKE
jgi:hypothetical protein